MTVTIFLTFVAVGLVCNLWILFCVSRECWRAKRKTGVVEIIPTQTQVIPINRPDIASLKSAGSRFA